MVGRVQTSSKDDDQCIWESLTSIEEIIDNAFKIFDRKLDEFPTLSFEKIKYSNSISSSHGTSLASELSWCAELTSKNSAVGTKTCERHINLANEPFFFEEKPYSAHLNFRKKFVFELKDYKSISHEVETISKTKSSRETTPDLSSETSSYSGLVLEDIHDL